MLSRLPGSASGSRGRSQRRRVGVRRYALIFPTVTIAPIVCTEHRQPGCRDVHRPCCRLDDAAIEYRECLQRLFAYSVLHHGVMAMSPVCHPAPFGEIEFVVVECNQVVAKGQPRLQMQSDGMWPLPMSGERITRNFCGIGAYSAPICISAGRWPRILAEDAAGFVGNGISDSGLPFGRRMKGTGVARRQE